MPEVNVPPSVHWWQNPQSPWVVHFSPWPAFSTSLYDCSYSPPLRDFFHCNPQWTPLPLPWPKPMRNSGSFYMTAEYPAAELFSVGKECSPLGILTVECLQPPCNLLTGTTEVPQLAQTVSANKHQPSLYTLPDSSVNSVCICKEHLKWSIVLIASATNWNYCLCCWKKNEVKNFSNIADELLKGKTCIKKYCEQIEVSHFKSERLSENWQGWNQPLQLCFTHLALLKLITSYFC
jgi:hypothetical protein